MIWVLFNRKYTSLSMETWWRLFWNSSISMSNKVSAREAIYKKSSSNASSKSAAEIFLNFKKSEPAIIVEYLSILLNNLSMSGYCDSFMPFKSSYAMLIPILSSSVAMISQLELITSLSSSYCRLLIWSTLTLRI